MRVAHLLRKYNPAEWGGTETVIQQLFEGLRRDGVESTVYCPEIAAANAPDPLVASGCQVQRFRACVPIWGISPEQRRQMISVGGNLMSFDLIRALWSTPFTVIHSHALGRIGGIGLTMARRKKIPFVVTVHGGVYDLPETLRRAFNAPQARGVEWGKPFGFLLRARHVLTEADAILTCNPREAALIRQQHPDRRVIVQPHGVRAEIYETDQRAAARAAFPEIVGRTVVLSLGRIDGVKNQRWLLEQAPELLRRYPDLLLVLAGAVTDEAYGEALRHRIDELGLSGNVLLTGKLPPADPRLVGLMQEAKVAILQSVSETFGLVILEAWAAGTPAVSSRTSGASALIEHGHNGWLFDLDRPADFHAAVETAISNDDARQRAIPRGGSGSSPTTTRVSSPADSSNSTPTSRRIIMRYVIIRDDDTNALTPVECLEKLYRPFLARGLPVNLAVIPEVRTDVRLPDGRPEGFLPRRATPGTSALMSLVENVDLTTYLRANPGYNVTQHGCHHDYFEFDSMDRMEVVRRLELGRVRLREAGFERVNSFVAPYDKLSRVAFEEVAKRYRVLSTGWFEWRGFPARGGRVIC